MLILLSLLACVTDEWEAPVYEPVEAGAPVAGAAEAALTLPIGTPLGGYTARCSCLSGQSRIDKRQSAYNYTFIESAGVHTHPTIKVIWLENGDDHLVITKTDQIYSYDALVEDLEQRLGEATGLDLDGKVMHTTNHSHSSYGAFSDQLTFYLGTDKYNEEIFQRLSTQIADVALDAYENRTEVKLGMHTVRDWDPNDQVYSDRRGENNDLVIWEDQELPNGKDPHLSVLRIDTLDDQPLAMMVNFGMHGIVLSEASPMVSYESGGALETALQEEFDHEVVVMFTQGSGGDQSPRGEQDDFARLESIGERATPAIMDVWANAPLSTDPITLETASRAIPQHPRQIHVTRNGEVDWYYLPYDPNYQPDDVVYDSVTGELLSPFDEFNTSYGSVFCGTGDLDFPVGRLNTAAYPYSNCMEVELMSSLIQVFFDVEPEDFPLPLPESLKANTAATRIRGLHHKNPDGSEDTEDLLMGFFPAEATSLFTEQWRRRAKAELGYEHAMMVAYSMDHEGYFLLAEDWLSGGYEPDIAVWGPLQGEHVMEGVLAYSDEILSTDIHEPSDPLGKYQPTEYPDKPLPTHAPDKTPNAGTLLTEVPTCADPNDAACGIYWAPIDIVPELTPYTQVRRVQDLVQVGWIGGDPGVDEPILIIEQQQPDGSFAPMTTRSGRTITSSMHDFLLSYTPDPLYPFEAEQTHWYWAGWQAVPHLGERAALPLGTYRITVKGEHYTGSDATWPWTATAYEVSTAPFEVVPADLDVREVEGGLSVSLPASPEGFRYVAAGGRERGDNPITGPVTVEFELLAGGTDIVEDVAVGDTVDHRSTIAVTVPADAAHIRVIDAHGNIGELPLVR